MSNWPDSSIDQQVFLQSLEDRLIKLRNAVKPIVVHKFIEPSQDDWEQAWSTASGYYPPIPPGVKLLWYDLSSGTMRQYATCHNLSSGLDSDGTVYPVRTDYENDGDYFRFLGNLHMEGAFQSAYFRGNGTDRSLYINPKLWQQKGLRKIIIEFCLALSGESAYMEMNRYSDESLDIYAGNRENPDISNTSTIKGVVQGTAHTVTLTAGGQSVLHFVSAVTRTLPTVGRIIIDPMLQEEIAPQIFAPKLTAYGFYVGDDTDLNTAGFVMSSASWSVASAPGDIHLQSGSFDDRAEAMKERGWVYGIFNTRQEQEIREF
jgi:hypothetical protein